MRGHILGDFTDGDQVGEGIDQSAERLQDIFGCHAMYVSAGSHSTSMPSGRIPR